MDRLSIGRACAVTGIRVGRRIREAVHALPAESRAAKIASPTKPVAGDLARRVDQVGEEIALAELDQLSNTLGYRFAIIVDPRAGKVHRVGNGKGSEVIFTYLDAVDGTIKVGGLGNDLERGRFRSANDGGWAAALAFTLPTRNGLDGLRIGDFVAAAIVEGNPTRVVTCPQEVLTIPTTNGAVSYDVTGSDLTGMADWRRTFTTTNADLSQSMVYLDSFQAFDRATRLPGDEVLAVEMYGRLINRHEGGAFDVLRQYANLSALPRVMLGWRDGPIWTEAQGGAFIVINENMFNLAPAAVVMAGAGGSSVDFEGKPIDRRLVVDERTSVVHAANPTLQAAALRHVTHARTAVKP